MKHILIGLGTLVIGCTFVVFLGSNSDEQGIIAAVIFLSSVTAVSAYEISSGIKGKDKL